ncbi:MAG TPA: sigma-70 family RNA polymerase sigma factor, partial [Gemmataceae bacterium]|nr:sigma-70 family RNA polymerase sigma factor [Gemmataceae bacterium]
MANSPPVMEALRRLAGPGPDDVTDADLLARFVTGQDGSAFEALVRRHGGLVWGACRRRLRDEHAAEDAFQTTFLALARHAAGIRRPDTLGAWLHRVAVRCTTAFRRPARDAMSAPPPDAPALGADPAAAAASRDLERLIDAEIDALPEPFREAFILCEVEDQTAAAAAAALGCPVGTVESRLTRARARLRERLAKRGVTAGALVGLGLGTGPAPAAAAAGAVAAATGAAGTPALWAVIADRAVGKGAAALGLGFVGGLALVGLGGLWWALSPSAGQTGPVAPVAIQREAPPDAGIPEPDQFRRNRFNFPLPPEAIARVGDGWLRHGAVPHRLAFSGDGRFLAAAGANDRWLRVWDLTTGRPRMHFPLAPGEVPAALALSPDGATLRAVIHTRDDRTAHLREYDTYRVNETRRRTLAGGLATTAVFDADGARLLEARDGFVRLLDTVSTKEVWRTPVPPGTNVDLALCSAGRAAIIPAGSDRIRVVDLATGRPEGELVEAGTRLSLPALSADGR